MIIQSDGIRMNSGRNYSSSSASYKSLSVWDNNTGFYNTLSAAQAEDFAENKSQNAMLDAAKEMIDEEKNESTASKRDSIKSQMDELMERFKSAQSVKAPDLNSQIETIRKIQRQTLDYLLYLLFGRKPLDEGSAANIEDESVDGSYTSDYSTLQSSYNKLSNKEAGQNEHIGGSYSSFTYYSESETTTFDTKGTVVTADGRSIDFNISVKMSRRFAMATKDVIDFGEKRCTDPLVINLNSNVASVSDQKFLFDLDADGETESISILNSGSGYLALDKNGDGIINDGSELFGTKSGNGFADLSAYDRDGNGWIDEADEIFDKLKIWTMNEDGTSTLVGLGKAGVGAIYLGSADTEFSLNSVDNTTNAVIRKTGLFLYENGMAGTMQQMDLAT